MFINRYTKFALTIALALAGRQFFGMAAAPVVAAPISSEEQLLKAHGNLNKIKILFAEHPKININVQNCWGESPLLLNSSMGYLDIVRYLTERGADVHVRDNYGQTALDLAKRFGSDNPNFTDFPPELIDRVLRPTIMATLTTK